MVRLVKVVSLVPPINPKTKLSTVDVQMFSNRSNTSILRLKQKKSTATYKSEQQQSVYQEIKIEIKVVLLSLTS